MKQDQYNERIELIGEIASQVKEAFKKGPVIVECTSTDVMAILDELGWTLHVDIAGFHSPTENYVFTRVELQELENYNGPEINQKIVVPKIKDVYKVGQVWITESYDCVAKVMEIRKNQSLRIECSTNNYYSDAYGIIQGNRCLRYLVDREFYQNLLVSLDQFQEGRMCPFLGEFATKTLKRINLMVSNKQIRRWKG